MTEKPDPCDVAALESALNDSATRVSTIWVSYLIFALYLLIATGMTTHRQLLLEEPLKLPALNIDLPLFWFFVLAPILFVLFHLYVLLQVLLLGRTAAAYNEIINSTFCSAAENALMRLRLANTLFAQIFAGSPRERGGWLGWLLRAMAWITLALGPIGIILAFQFRFLPYHDHLATWTHRLLLLAELSVAFLLWPLVLDPQKDFNWPELWRRFPGIIIIPLRSLFSRDQRRNDWRWLGAQVISAFTCILLVAVSLSLASFPGEPHVNLFTGSSLSTARCDRWISQKFDRLMLPNVDVVDTEKLDKIRKATAARGLKPSEGERTRSFRERDLSCGVFNAADFRRTDFDGAHLQGANLFGAWLQDANLHAANLQGANLNGAKLQSANFTVAHLEGANLEGAELQGAILSFAKLQRAGISVASLQGASLLGAWLQGADLSGAELQGANLSAALSDGANLSVAHLQGADLSGARLVGANLLGAELQGANLRGARLVGANLIGAWLQGADLSNSELTLALFSQVYAWRARLDLISAPVLA
jgi:uncharacterized protein YjbI with pentapeptide repeats